MIVKIKDKEYSFDGYASPINSIQKIGIDCYEQGRADAIDDVICEIQDAELMECEKIIVISILEQLKENKE